MSGKFDKFLDEYREDDAAPILDGSVNFTGDITFEGDLTVQGDVFFTGLPTSQPAVQGQVWNDLGTLKINLETFFLLLEDGSYLLQENGNKILLE